MADMAALVTIADVLTKTGATVTDPQILQAQGIVSLVTGMDLDAVDWNVLQVRWPRDQRKVRQAIAYQAAFIAAHPDVFTAADITTSTADGATQGYTDKGTVLAPLAKIALRKMSKFRSRSTHVRLPAQTPVYWNGTVLVPEWTDALDEWVPFD